MMLILLKLNLSLLTKVSWSRWRDFKLHTYSNPSENLLQWFFPEYLAKFWYCTVCVLSNYLVGSLFFSPSLHCTFSCVDVCVCVIEWVDQPLSQIPDGEILAALGKNQVIIAEHRLLVHLTWSDRGKRRDFWANWRRSLWIDHESIKAYLWYFYQSLVIYFNPSWCEVVAN